MNAKIKDLVEQISSLEKSLKEELDKEETDLSYKIKEGKVWFDSETLAIQKEALTGLFRYLKESPILYILTAPVIYVVIIPAFVLDLFVTIYQHINFRVYKIPIIKRSDYIVFDRHYLAYLNMIEKINCLYCSYFNGLVAYVGEVASATEQFWCPIKHAKKVAYRHSRYDRFIPYGDADYHRKLEKLRKELQQSEK